MPLPPVSWFDLVMRYVLNVVFLLIAIGSASYAAARIPVELDLEPMTDIADRIVLGSDFDLKALERFEPSLLQAEGTAPCDSYRGPVAAIRTYQMQQAAADSDEPRALRAGREAARDLRRKLACAPSDGLSWFSLFLIESTLSGRARANLPLLKMSYQLTPNEGWIAQTRGRIAPALLPYLDPELTAFVQGEFVGMLRDSPAEAVAVITGASDSLRARLLPLIDRLPPESRANVRRALDEGDVPTLPSPSLRR